MLPNESSRAVVLSLLIRVRKELVTKQNEIAETEKMVDFLESK